MSRCIEHRTAEIRFHSLRELIRYFRIYLPENLIELTILKAGRNFVSRTFAMPEVERMQFIRMCLSNLEADARRTTCEHGIFAIPDHARVYS